MFRRWLGFFSYWPRVNSYQNSLFQKSRTGISENLLLAWGTTTYPTKIYLFKKEVSKLWQEKNSYTRYEERKIYRV